MSNKKTSGGFPLVVSALAIVICIAIGWFIYLKVLGAPSNFEGNDPVKGHPHNLLGTMFKGGVIVPFLLGFFLTVWTFAIERFINIMKANGKGQTDKFISKIKSLIANHDFDAAIADGDRSHIPRRDGRLEGVARQIRNTLHIRHRRHAVNEGHGGGGQRHRKV